MAKFAIYIESGGHYGRTLHELIEAETIGQAEEKFWKDGVDICDGSCYEDEDEDDGVEPECQCYVELEEVPDDAEINRGKIFSPSEYLKETREKLESDISYYKNALSRVYEQIKDLEEKSVILDEKFSEALEALKEFNYKNR